MNELRLFVVGSIIGHFEVLAEDGNGRQFSGGRHGDEAQEGDLFPLKMSQLDDQQSQIGFEYSRISFSGEFA